MKIIHRAALLVLIALVAAPQARAQMAFELSPFAGSTFFLAGPPARYALDDGMILRDADFGTSFTLGLDAGIRLNERWAIEGMFSWLPTNLSAASGLPSVTDVNAYMYGLTALYNLPIGDRVSPFVGLGVGGETFDYQIAGVDTHTDWMGNAVVGLRLELTDRFGLRLEARDCIARFESGVAGVDNSWENDLMTTLGFTFATPIG